MIHVAVQPEAIDPGAELNATASEGAGGLASFTGIVRADDGVESLELEHYPGATEAVLRKIAEEAVARWGLAAVRIVHRIGVMRPGETVVFVGTAAQHRAPAIEACAYLIDRLKSDVPFWKKETRGPDVHWVEPRGSDKAAAARWKA